MAKKNTGNIYSVSGLTREIKVLLEDSFPIVWVTGEISNLAQPSSGHTYFTLKDATAVISAVMFKNQKRSLKFNLENGQQIFGLARISLYEPRGSYQLIFEHIEPFGTGSLQIAFEQLKNKLQKRGWFDDAVKKPIPFLPEKVCVITSGTGAAVKDIIKVATRRFPNCQIDIIPVKVQGEQAVPQIFSAFETAQKISRPDVIILARGGGSLEDLHAFNSEQVAESVFNCSIPVVTGIGHEIDFSIADFVADLRAPTPSAAAEMVFPDKAGLADKVISASLQLEQIITRQLVRLRQNIEALSGRLKSPEMIIYSQRLHIEDLTDRLSRSFCQQVLMKQQQIRLLIHSILACSPEYAAGTSKSRLILAQNRLNQAYTAYINRLTSRLDNATSKLDALSPDKILRRGYSITRTVPGQKVLYNTTPIEKDDTVEIILSQGRLTAKVEEKYGENKNI